jgi:hypothetical protein
MPDLQALRPSLLVALAVMASPVHAAIYKCQEAGGRTVYQQSPCPAGGTVADIHPHHPTAEEEKAARQRSQQDKADADKLEREQEARRQEALQEAEDRKATRRQTAERCARYLEDAKELTRRSQTRSKVHDREYDEHQAEALRNRHFSECYVANR